MSSKIIKNQSETKRLIVILGMHRSGTSAIARGLKVFGVELGHSLIPAMDGINDKGFWEDIDFNALNIEMLSTLGCDWYHLSPLESRDFGILHKEGYFLRAVELLRQKITAMPIFGFKDPRLVKLLPFWKDVFSYCQLDVYYVLAIRHPLSVAKSLNKRDGIEAEQSHLLWLVHVLKGLTEITGEKRVLVDYDRLMDSPDRELMRVSKCIGLEIDPEELQIYTSEFLDKGLQHTVYELNDLLLDDICPEIIVDVYTNLLDVASDKVGFIDLNNKILRWSEEYERLKSSLVMIDKLLTQKLFATQLLGQRDKQINLLNQVLAERDGQIITLNQFVAEQDGQISSLNYAVAERDGQISNIIQAVAEQDRQINSLNYAVAERDEQIISLNQAVVERDAEIISLNQTVTERDGKMASLNETISERDAYIRELISSNSWFVTKPLRWVSRIVRGDFIIAMEPIKKILNLSNSSDLSFVVADMNGTQATAGLLSVSPIKPTHPVVVIVPVYLGVEMTKRCILAAIPGILAVPNARIMVINDASPDTGMQQMLEKLAAQWTEVFWVQRNEKNLGFVGTVNQGFRNFPGHDAVLLNSDVIVPKDWLGRLIDEAYSNSNIGTVTPFTNNATICSFPHFLQENSQPFNLAVDTIDAIFRSTKLPCAEAPTGVGFCMYIRRACLDEIGYFNEEKFGRGYGEENDLCQRALKRGWLNIISPNIYAYHEGSVSFSSEKQSLVDRAMQVIEVMHPNYHADVQNFIRQDPLKRARVARYIQLLSTIAVPKVLHVSHEIGGGVWQHIEELAQYFEQRKASIILSPYGGNGAVSISFGVDQLVDRLVFNIPEEYESMVELLKAAGISAIHFHHTVGLDSKILDLPNDLGIKHLFTIHDYYWLNGNPTLTDENGIYPGYYSDTLNNHLYSLPEGLSIENFRKPLIQLFKSAECVIFPTDSTRLIYSKIFPLKNGIVASHIEMDRYVNKSPIHFTRKNKYTIGALGAIGREKGADLLEEIALTAKNAGLPINFKLLGYAYRPLNVVEVTGPYSAKALVDLIKSHGLDVIFFSARWPETYSYTLSYALDSGLPIIAPQIGAFPERLSGRVNTLLYDHLLPATELMSLFMTFIEKLAEGRVVNAAKYKFNKPKRDYYSKSYLEVVGRGLKVSDPNQVAPFLLNPIQLFDKPDIGSAGWKEDLLVFLWRLYMHNSMQWVGRLIPFRARRSVKRFLSVYPMHAILKNSGSKKLP